MAKVAFAEPPWDMVLVYPQCPFAGLSEDGSIHETPCYHANRKSHLCGTHFVGADDELHYTDNQCPFDIDKQLRG